MGLEFFEWWELVKNVGGSGFWVLGSGFWVQGFGFRVLVYEF